MPKVALLWLKFDGLDFIYKNFLFILFDLWFIICILLLLDQNNMSPFFRQYVKLVFLESKVDA